MSTFTIIHGPAEGAPIDGVFDAMLCDPPYGITFMGAAWDRGVPSSAVWQRLAEHLRPGANVVAFGGTRTWHRLAVAIEDAGLEMRDSIISWMYGTGWPKPADVSKYVDKALGAQRRVTAVVPDRWSGKGATYEQASMGERDNAERRDAPATPEAERWSSYHANLKPAWEPALMFRVPLDGTLARNALDHGVAGLNVDGCRIGTDIVGGSGAPAGGITWNRDNCGLAKSYTPNPVAGRWPANVALCCGCQGERCEFDCPVRMLDEQSGVTRSSSAPRHNTAAGQNNSKCYGGSTADFVSHGHSDRGGASRFFYVAKVSPKERGDSKHPCMKPIKLCEYIARLLLPPPRADGAPRRILVPFSGSGSEMVGALLAGWDEVVGIESDAQWIPVAEQRCADALDNISSKPAPGASQ